MDWVVRSLGYPYDGIFLDADRDGFLAGGGGRIVPFGKFVNSPDLVMAAAPHIRKLAKENNPPLRIEWAFEDLMKETICEKESRAARKKHVVRVGRRLLNKMNIRSKITKDADLPKGDYEFFFEGNYTNESGSTARIIRWYGHLYHETKTEVKGDLDLALKVMKAYDQGAKAFSIDMEFERKVLSKEFEAVITEEDKTYWNSMDRLMCFSAA